MLMRLCSDFFQYKYERNENKNDEKKEGGRGGGGYST